MHKTTIYLPDALKRAISRAARTRGVSEATVIRDALTAELAGGAPRPRPGLFAGSEPVAERVDEVLAGFGE